MAVLLAGVVLAAAASAPAAALPKVTMIGDSVSGAIAYEKAAIETLRRGADVDLQFAPCRRVGQTSCPYKDTTAPTVLDLLGTLGQKLAGSTVIVAVGYNDFEQAYAGNIEDALAAMRNLGVKRVVWMTLRAERQSYLAMNDMIKAAAARHPEMTVADWNLYSRSHPDWFQPDGLHLGWQGARAMATLLRTTLMELGIVTEPVPRLKIAASTVAGGKEGRPFSARLTASGGKAPYRWTRASGAVPGLRLTGTGRLTGTPTAIGRFTFVVRVTDSARTSATRRLVVRIR
ncbi:MAG: putative Ig domain-containing protein [Gaiellaceae bacterium]